MARVVEWIQGFAMSLGGPGLFIIAFLLGNDALLHELTRPIHLQIR